MFALIQSLPLDLIHESDDNALQLGNVILEFGSGGSFEGVIIFSGDFKRGFWYDLMRVSASGPKVWQQSDIETSAR